MSLLIIDHVIKGLKASAALKQKIGTASGKMKLYPLIIPEGADIPYVVVTDAEIEPERLSKDGGVDYDSDLIAVVAVARELGEATDIALEIRKALETYTAERDDYAVYDAWMEKAKPAYNQDLRAYVWEMTFGYESNDL